jgi:hypothetical protein
VINAFADGVRSDSDSPMLEGVPPVAKGEKDGGPIFPLLYQPLINTYTCPSKATSGIFSIPLPLHFVPVHKIRIRNLRRKIFLLREIIFVVVSTGILSHNPYPSSVRWGHCGCSETVSRQTSNRFLRCANPIVEELLLGEEAR